MHTFYEFFAGGGMARAGLGESWRCLFANDFDEKKAASYAANWGDEHLQVADVAQLTVGDLPSCADLAWASFPCQDLSLAGKGSGLKGERSGTFWPFWTLIEDLRAEGRAPALIVLENVCGALTSHKGRDFAAIAEALTSSGYRFGAIVMDAVDFVPQSRSRLFIVGVSREMEIPGALASDWPDSKWHPRTLEAAHWSLPEQLRRHWLWWKMPHPAPHRSVLADLIEEEPQGIEWHDSEETDYLVSLMNDVHLTKVRKAKRAGGRHVGTIYRRTRPDGKGGRRQRAEIRFDGVAGCLRTPVGGSSRQTIMIVQDGRLSSRLLSPREAARLMGLPDSYRLPDHYNSAYHLAGDGLVVPVVRHLNLHLLQPLAEAKHKKAQEAA